MKQRGGSETDFFFVLLLLSVLIFSLAWLIGWSLFGWNPFSSEVKTYPVACKGEIAKGHCKGKILVVGPEIYAVFPEKQMVIYQNLETGESPTEFSKCTVRNKRNWVCNHAVLGQLEMIDGDLKYPWDVVRYLPKWRWWTCKYSVYFCKGVWSS
jgi:hypothetical protein